MNAEVNTLKRKLSSAAANDGQHSRSFTPAPNPAPQYAQPSALPLSYGPPVAPMAFAQHPGWASGPPYYAHGYGY